MQNTSPLDKSSSPYYVDNRFCIGDKCIYSGIILNNLAALHDKSWSISISDNLSNQINIGTESSALDISTMTVYEAVNAMKDAIASAIAEDEECIINQYTDIVCVAAPYKLGHIEEAGGRGAIFFSDRVTVTYSDSDTGALAWIFSNGTEQKFYHLCQAISFVFGTCREHLELQDENRNSNITSSHFYVPPIDGDPVRWEAGSKPVILDNCIMCDYCISYCPHKAIHNRLTGTYETTAQITYGNITEPARKTLKEQIYRNAKVITGDKAYKGIFGSAEIGDLDGGVWSEYDNALAQYLDTEGRDEVIIDVPVTEAELAALLDDIYPDIVIFETAHAYVNASEDIDINYWIDDVIGGAATQKVVDSEDI